MSFAPEGTLANRLFRPTQNLIQDITKVGLYYIELALRHGDTFGKIVDNTQSGETDGADCPHRVHLPTRSEGGSGLPLGAADTLTLPDGRIGA